MKVFSRSKKKPTLRSARDRILPDADTQLRPQDSRGPSEPDESGPWRHSPVLVGSLFALVLGGFLTEFTLRWIKSTVSRSPIWSSETSGAKVDLTSQLADSLVFDSRPLLKRQARALPSSEEIEEAEGRALPWEQARLLFTREMHELEGQLLELSSDPESQISAQALDRLLVLSLSTSPQHASLASTRSALWQQIQKNPEAALRRSQALLTHPLLMPYPGLQEFLLQVGGIVSLSPQSLSSTQRIPASCSAPQSLNSEDEAATPLATEILIGE